MSAEHSFEAKPLRAPGWPAFLRARTILYVARPARCRSLQGALEPARPRCAAIVVGVLDALLDLEPRVNALDRLAPRCLVLLAHVRGHPEQLARRARRPGRAPFPWPWPPPPRAAPASCAAPRQARPPRAPMRLRRSRPSLRQLLLRPLLQALLSYRPPSRSSGPASVCPCFPYCASKHPPATASARCDRRADALGHRRQVVDAGRPQARATAVNLSPP